MRRCTCLCASLTRQVRRTKRSNQLPAAQHKRTAPWCRQRGHRFASCVRCSRYTLVLHHDRVLTRRCDRFRTRPEIFVSKPVATSATLVREPARTTHVRGCCTLDNRVRLLAESVTNLWARWSDGAGACVAQLATAPGVAFVLAVQVSRLRSRLHFLHCAER